MKSIVGCLLSVAAVAIVAGCEWETYDSGDVALTDNGFSWANFSGTYRPASGSGMLVTDPAYPKQQQSSSSSNSATPGTTPGAAGATSVITTNTLPKKVLIAKGNGISTTLAGTFEHNNIVPGTLTISSPPWNFKDDKLGVMTSSNNAAGTIEYATGRWFLDFNASAPGTDQEFYAKYQYLTTVTTQPTPVTPTPTDSSTTASNVTNTADGRGNLVGKPIYTITLQQAGNSISATDSNGDQYDGFLYELSSSSGAGQLGADGTVIGQFRLSGLGRKSNVTIEGTLLGDYSLTEELTTQEWYYRQRLGQNLTTESASTATLENRTITATWIEHDPSGNPSSAGDLSGVADVPEAQTDSSNNWWGGGYYPYYYYYPWYYYY